jgi:hypothetical protein
MPPYYKAWFRQIKPRSYWLENSHEADLVPAVAVAKACGFQGFHYVILGHKGRDYEQLILSDSESNPTIKKLYPHGFDKATPGSIPNLCKDQNLEYGFHAFWPIGENPADYHAIANNTPKMIDLFKKSGAEFCWYEDPKAGASNLSSKYGWASMADQIRKEIPGFKFARTWIREVESMNVSEVSCPWDAHGQGYLNSKEIATLDHYYMVNNEWRGWAIANWYRPTYLNITMISSDLQCKDGVGSAADLDFMMASHAFLSPMHVGGMIEKTTVDQREVIKKWVDWNWKNREIIQYSQPLDVDHKVAAIDGIMHLTDTSSDTYGFIGIWNADAAQSDRVTLRINPDLYDISIATETLRIIDIATGATVPFTLEGETITVTPTLSPRSYRALELKR